MRDRYFWMYKDEKPVTIEDLENLFESYDDPEMDGGFESWFENLELDPLTTAEYNKLVRECEREKNGYTKLDYLCFFDERI